MHPDNYKRPPKCPVCGSSAGWRVEGRDYNKRGLCHCDSVINALGVKFPHRKGRHKMCDYHPHGYYNQAKRAGICDDEIPLEYLGRRIAEHEPCPF